LSILPDDVNRNLQKLYSCIEDVCDPLFKKINRSRKCKI